MIDNSSQQGKFFNGTYGYPLLTRLRVRLTEVSAITLVITRPNRSLITRSLTVPDAITNIPRGEILYNIQDGDLTVAGVYGLRVTVDKTGNRRLVAETTFIVG